jgi:hypothetical protein
MLFLIQFILAQQRSPPCLTSKGEGEGLQMYPGVLWKSQWQCGREIL